MLRWGQLVQRWEASSTTVDDGTSPALLGPWFKGQLVAHDLFRQNEVFKALRDTFYIASLCAQDSD